MLFFLVGRDGFVKLRRENRPQDAFLILLFESVFLWETKKVIFFSEYYLILGGQRWIRQAASGKPSTGRFSDPPFRIHFFMINKKSNILFRILLNFWCEQRRYLQLSSILITTDTNINQVNRIISYFY
mgnify:FL=1